MSDRTNIGGLFKLVADLRSDAKLAKLDDTQWAALFEVVSSGDKKAFQKFLAEHGIKLADQNIIRQRNTLSAAAKQMMQRAALLAETRKLADKAGISLTGAALEQAVVAVGDLLDAAVDPASPEGQKLLLAGLNGLTGARSVEVQDRRVTQQGAALKLAEKKFRQQTVDAVKKAAADPAIQAIIAGSGNNDEKTEALGRALFGEDWDK